MRKFKKNLSHFQCFLLAMLTVLSFFVISQTYQRTAGVLGGETQENPSQLNTTPTVYIMTRPLTRVYMTRPLIQYLKSFTLIVATEHTERATTYPKSLNHLPFLSLDPIQQSTSPDTSELTPEFVIFQPVVQFRPNSLATLPCSVKNLGKRQASSTRSLVHDLNLF